MCHNGVSDCRLPIVINIKKDKLTLDTSINAQKEEEKEKSVPGRIESWYSFYMCCIECHLRRIAAAHLIELFHLIVRWWGKAKECCTLPH